MDDMNDEGEWRSIQDATLHGAIHARARSGSTIQMLLLQELTHQIGDLYVVEV